jgi:peptide/nickel transport system ATP-binding protein
LANSDTKSERVAPPGLSNEPLLQVQDLKTHFQVAAGLVRAVDGVSLTLERGKTLGIVGESGSGKTVLARSIMRLNLGDHVVASGSAKFEGKELLDIPMKDMPNLWGVEMAMIFQDPMTSLNPVVKIGRQVTEHIRHHHGVSKSEAKEQAIALLKSVRIPSAEARFSAYPHELSGGMRQRVSIAIALACGPKLIFADEPTTALDVTVQHSILNLLAQQQRERYMAMILVTHDLGVVAGRADEIIVMYAGKVVEQAPTATLFAAMRHPYTEALMRSIPKVSERSHTRLSAIAGRPPDLINPPKGCSFSPRCAYAQPQCFEEEPPLVKAPESGHKFACWLPVGSREAQEAFDRNLAARVPQTVAIAEGRVAEDISGEAEQHAAEAVLEAVSADEHPEAK